MKNLQNIIKKIAKELFIKATTELPDDVILALKSSYKNEDNIVAKEILNVMLTNAKIAKNDKLLICQDTGIPVYFLELGENFPVKVSKIKSAIIDGCKNATLDFPMRPNILSPITRKNTLTNTGDKIPLIDIEFIPNKTNLKIKMMPKGSGSENMSKVGLLSPAEGIESIKNFVIETVRLAGANPCPPTIVGVGIGGTLDLCAKLAKRALLRKIGTKNNDNFLSELEEELLVEINELGIGPMGLGGKTTSLGVFIESASAHISMNPVCVNIQCWAGRRAEAKISASGKIKL